MNWLKQTDEPLFPDVLWSRPENRRHAGKLLIIGGHSQSFSAVSETYAAAGAAGIGTARVIVPDKLRPMLITLFPEAEYAASNEIGSFSRRALAEMLDSTDWADSVLLAGDFGKNSETAVLLESFIGKYDGRLTVAGDTSDYFFQKPSRITGRSNAIIIGSVSQIQKLAHSAALKQQDDLAQLLNKLSEWTEDTEASIVTKQAGQVIVAHKGKISTTKVNGPGGLGKIAAFTSVWQAQQPGKPFEALTSAAWCYSQA